MDCDDEVLMELAQDRVQWRDLVLAVLNLRVLATVFILVYSVRSITDFLLTQVPIREL
jgi:hypothetical protein